MCDEYEELKEDHVDWAVIESYHRVSVQSSKPNRKKLLSDEGEKPKPTKIRKLDHEYEQPEVDEKQTSEVFANLPPVDENAVNDNYRKMTQSERRRDRQHEEQMEREAQNDRYSHPKWPSSFSWWCFNNRVYVETDMTHTIFPCKERDWPGGNIRICPLEIEEMHKKIAVDLMQDREIRLNEMADDIFRLFFDFDVPIATLPTKALLAMCRLIQKVAKSFFPKDQNMSCIVLVRERSGSKSGFHLIFTHCKVNHNKAMTIRNCVLHRFMADFGPVSIESKQKANGEVKIVTIEGWPKIIDEKVYGDGEGARASLRYPGSAKISATDLGRYLPEYVLNSNGSINDQQAKRYKCDWVLTFQDATIRTQEDESPGYEVPAEYLPIIEEMKKQAEIEKLKTQFEVKTIKVGEDGSTLKTGLNKIPSKKNGLPGLPIEIVRQIDDLREELGLQIGICVKATSFSIGEAGEVNCVFYKRIARGECPTGKCCVKIRDDGFEGHIDKGMRVSKSFKTGDISVHCDRYDGEKDVKNERILRNIYNSIDIDTFNPTAYVARHEPRTRILTLTLKRRLIPVDIDALIRKCNGYDIVHLTVDEEFLSRNPNFDFERLIMSFHDVFAKSPYGTGKTVLMIAIMKLIAKIVGHKHLILAVSTLKSMIANIFDACGKAKFHMKSYLQGSTDENGYKKKNLSSEKRMIITLDSLHRMRDEKNNIKPAFLVLDEIASTLPYLANSDTLCDKRKQATDDFIQAVSNSSRVMCVDNDITNVHIETIRKLRPNKRVLIIHNKCIKRRRNIVVNINKGNFVESYKRIAFFLNELKRVILATDFKGVADELYSVLKFSEKLTWTNKKPTVLLHTSHETDNNDELDKVEELWSQYQCVIYSPTVTTGVDYNLKGGHFDIYFGLYTGKSITERLAAHQLIRERETKEPIVYLEFKNKEHPPTNLLSKLTMQSVTDIIAQHTMSVGKKLQSFIVGSGEGEIKINKEVRNMLQLKDGKLDLTNVFTLIFTNAYLERLLSWFFFQKRLLNRLVNAGGNIWPPSPDIEEKSDFQKNVWFKDENEESAAVSAYKTYKANEKTRLIYTVKDLSESDVEELKAQQSKKNEEQAQIDRFFLKSTFGVKFFDKMKKDNRDAATFIEPKQQTKWKRLFFLADSNDAQMQELNDNMVNTDEQQSNIIAQYTITDLLQNMLNTFGITIGQDKKIERGTKGKKKHIDWFDNKANKDNLVTCLGKNPPKMTKGRAIDIYNNVVKILQLRLPCCDWADDGNKKPKRLTWDDTLSEVIVSKYRGWNRAQLQKWVTDILDKHDHDVVMEAE